MTNVYRAEANALDAEILRAITVRRVADFGDLSLRMFAHQLRYNAPYARYCASLGVKLDRLPSNWMSIPPVPAGAFKEAALCTFDPRAAALTFRTSGTTAKAGGLHYMENAALYDAALLAGFGDRFADLPAGGLQFMLLVPDPASHPHSSLGYMMQRVARTYGNGKPEWYVDGTSLDIDRFLHDVQTTRASGLPIFVASTAFALVALMDGLRERAVRLELPAGSSIMETGGFKGRVRSIAREQFYRDLEDAFGVPQSAIVSEYGMTELSSQYYDDGRSVKRGPPWLRSYAVDENGKQVPPGVVGALVHVDLANRSSCIAIQTEDLGAVVDGGIILIGREQGAELRGCSLDAESLRAVS